MLAKVSMAFFAGALVVVAMTMLKAQFKLFELFKDKKKPDYPVTTQDMRERAQLDGDNAFGSTFNTRFSIIFSKYPEDAELDALARKVRRLFIGGMLLMIVTFIVVGSIMIMQAVPQS